MDKHAIPPCLSDPLSNKNINLQRTCRSHHQPRIQPNIHSLSANRSHLSFHLSSSNLFSQSQKIFRPLLLTKIIKTRCCYIPRHFLAQTLYSQRIHSLPFISSQSVLHRSLCLHSSFFRSHLRIILFKPVELHLPHH